MAQGEILWFDEQRGFGFIRPDMGPKDVFLHISVLEEANIREVSPGLRVEFELVQAGDGWLLAQRVRATAGSDEPPPRDRKRRRRD